MIELVISTSSGALSVALIDGDAMLAEHHAVIGRGHAETIVGVIAGLIDDRGGEIGGVLVDIGPGSFTGVRIGVAAARALGLAWGVPVAGIGSLALVAAAAFAADSAETVVAIADAGRGRIYWQTFGRGGAVGAPAVDEPSAVIVPHGAAIAGTGADRLAARALAIAEPRAADARWLGESARAAPLPLYLGAALAA